MNLTNPHQTIRQEDRRDVQARTQRAARLVAQGVNPGVVQKIINSKSGMPKLDQGIHPAAEIVARYRQQAVTRLNELYFYMRRAGRGGTCAGMTDDELHKTALMLESIAADIQKYLSTKTAGGSND